MADKEKILEALSQIDPLNDNQWTTDGVPKIEVVGRLVGDFSIRRQDIVSAAPAFNRENPSIEINKTVENMMTEKTVEHVTVEKEFIAWLDKVPSEHLFQVEADLNKQLEENAHKIEEIKAFQFRVKRARNFTRIRMKQALPETNDQEAIRTFIHSQNEARANRVNRRNKVLKGIKPEDLNFFSPIDAAMSHKGNKRPLMR